MMVKGVKGLMLHSRSSADPAQSNIRPFALEKALSVFNSIFIRGALTTFPL
jgi:hypothetical protein